METGSSRSLEVKTARDYYIEGNTLVGQADNGIDAKHAHDIILKSYLDAIVAYTKALESEPHHSDYKSARSVAYRRRGEYMQLHGIDTHLIPAHFAAALRDNPDCDQCHYHVAAIQPNHASTITYKMECYNQAIYNNSRVAKYYNALGDVYKFQEDFEKAADNYLRALELDQLCSTTKTKKQLFEIFTKVNVKRQLELLKEAYLNPESPLGRRMYKPENPTIPMFAWFNSNPLDYDFLKDYIKCNPTKGILSEIAKQIKKLEPDWVDPHAPVQTTEVHEQLLRGPNLSGTVI